MNNITINEKHFITKKEAIQYINNLNEALVVKILAYPDLDEGTHGPRLKDEYYFKSEELVCTTSMNDTEPIIAALRNALISIYGREYDFVMGSETAPLKLWDVIISREISDKKNLKTLDIDKLVSKVKDSFKDRLY